MRTDESHLRGWAMSRLHVKKSWLVGAGVVALAVVVVFFANRADAPVPSSDDPLASVTDRDVPSAEATAAPTSGDTTVTPLVDTAEHGEVAPPKKKSSSAPVAGGSGGTGGTSGGGALTEEERQYLEDTRDVVETNQGDLGDVLDTVTAALSSGDDAALQKLVADDEPTGATYATDLAERYPPMLAAETIPKVDVYSAGGTTVYFAYQLVTWRDAGIESTHTIAVMFRFADGTWQLTTLGETATDLQYVQTVAL